MYLQSRSRAPMASLCIGFAVTGAPAQVIEVSPDNSHVATFAGYEGGPFAPTNATDWRLDNTAEASLDFAISTDQAWLIVAPASGTLPGSRRTARTVDVSPSLDADRASALAPGVYTAIVSFTNLTAGTVDDQRTVSLQIAPASMSVSPEFVNVTAVRDGPDPGSVTVTLRANGDVDLSYSVFWTLEPWLSVSRFRGTVPGSGSDTFEISFNTFGLNEGTYTSTVTIDNTTNGFGSRNLPVTLIVQAPQPGTVTVSPVQDLSLHGPAGDIPPGTQVYNLVNTGDEPIQWAAAFEAPWVTVSPASGELGTFEGSREQSVTIRTNAAVNDLPAGAHSAVVTFAQLVIQPVTLIVTEVPLDARIVRITADPVLTASVPQPGGTLLVEPGGHRLAASSRQILTRTFGEVVTLTAVPDDGFKFLGWSADFEIDDPLLNPLVVTMDSSHEVSAVFTPILRTLTVGSSGTGTGTILAAPTGVLIDNGLVSRYNNGTSVTLTATPDAGSVFLGWEGNVIEGSELDNPLVLEMDRDRTISGRFEVGVALTLDVSGNGTVIVEPDLAFYEVGAQVMLTAVPGDGSSFTGWTGDALGTGVTLTLKLEESMSVGAVFTDVSDTDDGAPSDRPGDDGTAVDNPDTATLTVEIEGNGVVTPPGGSFATGAVITLIATPGIGEEFVEWGGDATGSELTTVVVMDSDQTVRAVFKVSEAPAGQPSPGASSPTQLCGAIGMTGPFFLLFGMLGLLCFRGHRRHAESGVRDGNQAV